MVVVPLSVGMALPMLSCATRRIPALPTAERRKHGAADWSVISPPYSCDVRASMRRLKLEPSISNKATQATSAAPGKTASHQAPAVRYPIDSDKITPMAGWSGERPNPKT